MKTGTFYGVGVGPGDPGWMTVQAVSVLGSCRRVFAPKGKAEGGSLALEIARSHIGSQAEICEVIFPMTTDKAALSKHWHEAAEQVAEFLRTGEDACFLTLGDPSLYSTYVYLLRELKVCLPGVNVVTVPGVHSYSAAAALAEFPLGEGKNSISILPLDDDLTPLRDGIRRGDSLVLMKVGARLGAVLDVLEETGVLDGAVLVQKAGLAEQRIEKDLKKLKSGPGDAGYLSVLLVPGKKK